MNYRRLEKAMDKAFEEVNKLDSESLEGATAKAFYQGMGRAIHELGLWDDERNGTHTIKSISFVELYRNEDGACNCKKCELSAKCTMKNGALRLPNPKDPQSIGLCPKWVG